MVSLKTLLASLLIAAAIVAHARPGGAALTGTALAQAADENGAALLEEQLLSLVNADRAAYGLSALEVDPSLAAIARWRSEDMATRGYFSHDIGGYLVFQVLRDHGIAYRTAGENLAYHYPHERGGLGASPYTAEDALMRSPGHRANILRADYTHVGVGVAQAPDGRYLFTQLFKKAW